MQPSISLPRSSTSLKTKQTLLVDREHRELSHGLDTCCGRDNPEPLEWEGNHINLVLLRPRHVSASASQNICMIESYMSDGWISKPRLRQGNESNTFISNNSRTRGSYRANIPSSIRTWGEYIEVVFSSLACLAKEYMGISALFLMTSLVAVSKYGNQNVYPALRSRNRLTRTSKSMASGESKS